MNWLRENWFKVIIVLAVLMFGVYYLVVIIPTKALEEQIANCRILGEENRIKEITENPSISFYVPKYVYSKDLNTCIYSGGFYIADHPMTWDRYIVDLNTNRKLESSTYINDQYFTGLTTDVFDVKEDQLFSDR